VTMKRKIPRSERKAIREQFNLVRTEEKAEENASLSDINAPNEWKEAKREAKKDRRRQIQEAGRDLEAIASEDMADEIEKIKKQYFFSEGDMVEYKRNSRIVMEGEDDKDQRQIGLVIDTEDYVHERYGSGKPKLVSKCVKVIVLVGSVVEEWSSKNVRICE